MTVDAGEMLPPPAVAAELTATPARPASALSRTTTDGGVAMVVLGWAAWVAALWTCTASARRPNRAKSPKRVTSGRFVASVKGRGSPGPEPIGRVSDGETSRRPCW